ncbi:MAG: LPS export ABC transporter periplasmic protein LptC [Bacteroidia bacterium]|nr:LPS export ABC transporter periplasmic protein LptC [Sphingobacteriaceae bacterium]MBP9068348.1 LPS export ABC transporter periplasmic protein LptC [Bacteroidia bacterium]
MKFKAKHIFIYSALTLFAFSCTNDLKDVLAIPRNKLSPSQTADTVSMIYTDSAQLKVVIKANRLIQFDKNVSEPFTILSNGVNVTFFDEEEKVSSTLKANYAIRYELSKRMEAKYAVEVVNNKGEKLETEKLTWDEGTKRIYTKEFVKITTPTQIITGMGLESNEDFSKYSIKKVTAVIQLQSDEL